MAKKVVAVVKLQIPAGQATPAPPVGPALGQHGVNLMEFCKAFNAQTKGEAPGMVIPVVLTVYQDRSFTFITKSPPASVLLKQACGLAKGSAEPNRTKVAVVTLDQVRAIALRKMTDLNTDDLAMAVRVIEGTARAMGIRIAGEDDDAGA